MKIDLTVSDEKNFNHEFLPFEKNLLGHTSRILSV